VDRAMSSAKEFREYARECMDWASTARCEQERTIFLEMAQTWLMAAMRREAKFANLIEKVETGADAIPKKRNFSSSSNNRPSR
jgi:hypothetical protein